MIGSGRTRARIEQTVGNICEISIGLRAAKDPGRSNALPEGAILIHRVMGTMLSLWSWAYSIQASCNCFRLLGKRWTGLSASHNEQFDQRKSLSPRLGFRERVSGSVFSSRFHFFASIILSAAEISSKGKHRGHISTFDKCLSISVSCWRKARACSRRLPNRLTA